MNDNNISTTTRFKYDSSLMDGEHWNVTSSFFFRPAPLEINDNHRLDPT